jgi:PAS domain-containing protein
MSALKDNLTVLRDLTLKLSQPGISGTVHEEVLRDQNEIFRLVLDCMSEGVVVADTTGKFLIFNRAAERMFGICKQTGAVENWSTDFGIFKADKKTLFPTDELSLVKALRGLETNEAIYWIKSEHFPQGTWLSVNGRPMRDRHGKLLGGIVVCRVM